mgnify:CR=1 FL=1
MPPLRSRPRAAIAPRVAHRACAPSRAVAACWRAPAIGRARTRWTDANGRVIYSDQPPPGNVKVESINAPPPPANPNAVKDLANKEVELQKKKQVRAEDDTKANKARVDANLRSSGVPTGARSGDRARRKSDQVVLYTTNPTGRARSDGRCRALGRSGSGSTTDPPELPEQPSN